VQWLDVKARGLLSVAGDAPASNGRRPTTGRTPCTSLRWPATRSSRSSACMPVVSWTKASRASCALRRPRSQPAPA